MVKVYFETKNGSYAEQVATFEDESLFDICYSSLKAEATKQGYILTESVDCIEDEDENETEEETKKDLFEFYEEQPEELKELLSHYESFEELDYEELRAMRAECEKIGYTFDFYLDAQPYNLRKL